MKKTQLQIDLEKAGYKTEESKGSAYLQVKDLSIGWVKKLYTSDICLSYIEQFQGSVINQTSPNAFDVNFSVYYGHGNEKSSLQKSLEHFGYTCSKTADNKLSVVVKTLEEILKLGSKYREESFKENISITQTDLGYKIVFTNINYGTED